MSDVERIAEVLADHPGGVLLEDDGWHSDCECGPIGMKIYSTASEANAGYYRHVAEHLAAAGFGHVPTALHQAADALKVPGTLWHGDSGVSVMVDFAHSQRIPLDHWLRARADRTGGRDE